MKQLINTDKPKIFCLGLSRNGTTALDHALDSLGIQTLHYSLEAFVQINEISDKWIFEPKASLSRYRKWRLTKEVKAKRVKPVQEILDHNQAFSDLPFPYLYREMHQRFPNAKFIYTYRDEQKWLNSMKWLIEEGPIVWNQGLLDEEIRLWAYGCASFNEARLLKRYRQHHAEVQAYFKDSDNFLSLNIDQGELNYLLLTKFLDLPEIKQSLERINAPIKPSTRQQRIWKLRRKYDALDFCFLFCRRFTQG